MSSSIKIEIEKIHNYYKIKKELVRDFEIGQYTMGIMKMGLAWSLTYPYDEGILIKGINLIISPLQGTFAVNKDFIFLLEKNDEEYIYLNNKYCFQEFDKYKLLKFVSDNNVPYYYAVEEMSFIGKEISQEDLLALSH